MDKDEVQEKLQVYDRIVRAFAETCDNDVRTAKEQRVWIPRRNCAKDSVLSIWAYRISRRKFEIGLFAARDHYRYKRGSSVRSAVVCCLADALLAAGTMELHFIGEKDGGFEPTIPPDVLELAAAHGVQIAPGSMVSDSAGRSLFVNLSGVPESTISIFQRCGIDPVQIALHVYRGVWTPAQLILLSGYCTSPAKLLRDDFSTAERLRSQSNFEIARHAVMGERVRSLLEIIDEDRAQVEISWAGPEFLVVKSSNNVSLAAYTGTAIQFLSGLNTSILLYPDSPEGYATCWQENVESATEGRTSNVVYVTKDFDWIPATRKSAILSRCLEAGLSIVVGIDTRDELDDEIRRKADQFRSTYRPAPEMRE